VVAIEVTEDHADAIEAAAYGKQWTELPAWWGDFEKQYSRREWKTGEPIRVSWGDGGSMLNRGANLSS